MSESQHVTREHELELQEAGRAKTILLVDDREFERFTIRAAVEGLTNFQVCGEASNGVEAIDKAKKLKPDLVVMDLAMPLMNGLDAARILSQKMPNVPVIMFTSFCTPHMETEMLSAGVAKVISKSGPISDLIESVRCLVQNAA